MFLIGIHGRLDISSYKVIIGHMTFLLYVKVILDQRSWNVCKHFFFLFCSSCYDPPNPLVIVIGGRGVLDGDWGLMGLSLL